jgi:hypothetical protein
MAWLQRLTIREHAASTKDLIQDQMLVEFDNIIRTTRNYLGELIKSIADYSKKSDGTIHLNVHCCTGTPLQTHSLCGLI